MIIATALLHSCWQVLQVNHAEVRKFEIKIPKV